MHPVHELKQLREQMVEQLTQIPEYQALKAMERFIAEMTNIYETASVHDEAISQKAPIEMRQKVEPVSPAPRVTPYIPAHRVA
ncbi:hypothetical protein [Methylosinus sp. Sm6]|uniref:hypothetical protein n=1 Tax=Methylosinus sp. Sm6 TaxID=2866948 RepID=UPI001C9A240C|nr:hypothetical protein [Methylosinus sp. Sm6]MBY6240581.1 hypothetical protein [Methylosinus sp. Sm6]